MNKIADLKEKAKIGWASFISFEALTSTAAPKLVEFASVNKGMRLLDVACGTGVVALTASRTGAHVEGIDLTPELISRANENSKIMGLEANFIEGDAEFLPYDDRKFDVVVSQYGHMFAPRPEVVTKELARVLKFNYLDLGYITFGAGAFYRYGSYELESFNDNIAFKLNIGFSFN